MAAPGGGLQPGPASSFRRIKCLEGGMRRPEEGPGRNHPFRHGSDCELEELFNWKAQRSVEIIHTPTNEISCALGLRRIVGIRDFRGKFNGGAWGEAVIVVIGVCLEVPLRAWTSPWKLQ